MPSFEYEALDAGGRTKKGVVSADNARMARQELRRLALTPIEISAPKSKHSNVSGQKATKTISAGDLVIITRQLSVLVGAGTPLEEAINAVALQTDKEGVRKRLLSVREGVIEGRRFGDAMAEDKKSFPELYRAVVAAGETSGDLASVLDRLATMLEKNRAMKNKALASLIYPAALALVATLVIAALMTQVVPKIVEQFSTFNAELPFITGVVVGISNFLANYGLWLIAGLIVACVGFWRLLLLSSFKLGFDKWVLGIPLMGRLLRGLDGARFARTLSTLFAGGAPLLDSLQGARKTVGNTYIRERLDGSITMVREGASIAAALRKANALPPMMTHMVAAGERAGEVPALLDKAAIQLEEEFDTTSTVALRLLEPAIIMAMGGIVMAIVVAILLPILRLNALASG